MEPRRRQLSRRRPRAAALALAVSLLCACASPTIYHWGHYPDLLYAMYDSPDEADNQRQIELLLQDVRDAEAEGRPVPPGVHLHIGWLFLLEGNEAAARAEMEREVALFPEAGVLVERLLAPPDEAEAPEQVEPDEDAGETPAPGLPPEAEPPAPPAPAGAPA